MEDLARWIGGVFGAIWLAGVSLWINRHIKQVDDLDKRLQIVEQTYMPRDQVHQDLAHLSAEIKADMSYLRDRMDKIYERVSK